MLFTVQVDVALKVVLEEVLWPAARSTAPASWAVTRASTSTFCTINATIDFDGNADLFAAGGMLTVNGMILDVDAVGTADAAGVLNIPAAWETDGGPGNTIGTVSLIGGTLQGGAITNDNPNDINGRGTVASRVINNTRIDAENGGSLIVQTVANNNDWDGVANTGQLNAISGNLEVRDNAQFFFLGSSQIAANRELFINGFDLRYVAGSSLTMAAGSRLRGSASTDFGGTLTVAAGDSAEVQYQTPPFGFFFASTSNVTITRTLRVTNSLTTIYPGAVFSGGGTLLNPTGSGLRLIDNADVDVLVQNQGTMDVDAGDNAQVTGLDFQQDPSGVLQLTIGGDGLAEFDRINLTGAASLVGALELSLNDGFVPSLLNNPLTIISAPGGVTGQFTAVMEPLGLPAGLLYDVVYSPTLVQMVVVNAPIYSADFDLDGDVDGDDLNQWQGDFGVNDLGDADNDSDGTDFLAWQQQVGSVPVVSATAAVPEPGGWSLTLAIACGLLVHIAYRRASRSFLRRRGGPG